MRSKTTIPDYQTAVNNKQCKNVPDSDINPYKPNGYSATLASSQIASKVLNNIATCGMYGEKTKVLKYAKTAKTAQQDARNYSQTANQKCEKCKTNMVAYLKNKTKNAYLSARNCCDTVNINQK